MSSKSLDASFNEALDLNKDNKETMHKRSCPFEDDLTPQMKIHVGPHEVGDKTEKEKELGIIYAHTMKLLKNGPRNEEHIREHVLHKSKHDGYPFESPHLKQMVMNEKLELEISKKVILPLDNVSCSQCGKVSIVDRNSCFHCIDGYCADCLTECSKCLELFCQKCILTIYDGGEHIECLTCYH